MNRVGVLGVLAAFSGALWLCPATILADELPARVYACQVMTKAGVYGLVVVQADTEEEALASALRSEAWKMGGGRAEAISVVECVDRFEEQFKDSAFQLFSETLEQ